MGTEETAQVDDSNAGGGGAGGETGESGGGSSPIDLWWLVAYVAVAIAGVVAWCWAGEDEVTIVAAEGFASFAVIYVVAQAIERLLQPISEVFGKATQKKKAKEELARARVALASESQDSEAQRMRVVEAKSLLGEIEAHRALLFWMLATVASLLVCGYLELGLIQSVAKVTGTDGEIPDHFHQLDVVITGIAVGAGTKPLHDTISFIQAAKQKAEDPKPAG